MKKIPAFSVLLALLMAAAPLASHATLFFSDTFASGSTLTNLTPAAPTANSTAYQLSSAKTWFPTPSISSGHLIFGIDKTSAGTMEVQALFAAAPVALVLAGDYVELSITFTNLSGLLTQGGPLGFGLYNAGGVQPIAGGLNSTATTSFSDKATGGAQNWKGYHAQINFTGANSGFFDRQPQTTGTANNNQDLVSSGSSSQSYRNPSAAGVGTASSTPSVTLTASNQYTAILRYTLTDTNALVLRSFLFSGANTSGTMLSSNYTVTSASPVTASFDGLAFGWRSTGNITNILVDISAITVTGQSSVVTTPPDIVTQPVNVTVPSGGSCAFRVVAEGFGMTYQWKRHGTNLVNGGNLSGATSDTLIISPASTADAVAAGPNGYYVSVTGTGNYTTNSDRVALILGTAKNLIWAGTGTAWDLNTTANWLDGGNPATFNYGDAVTFDDSASIRTVNLTNKFLSASSVTVEHTGGAVYNFQSSSVGSFAGPGSLIYRGAGGLTIGNANTYSGGTIISNAGAYLLLRNYNGLGTGPVTLAKAGGQMEINDYGNASLGITGDIIVADDFTIQFDATSATTGRGTFSGVFFGNLSGTAGKILTLNPEPSNTTTNQRVRVYGNNTTYNADLVLNSPVLTLAPYHPNGTQIYNGIISGGGSLIQRGAGTTILKGQNTYSGGSIPSFGVIGLGVDTIGNVTSGPLGTGPLFIAPEIDTANSTGWVFAYGGARTIANPIQYPSGTNNQTLAIGGTNALTFTGAVTLQGNDSLGTPTNRLFSVTNTALTTFSGVISDGGAGYGLVKLGNGVLALSNTETYTGQTAISNGTLLVNGQLGAGAVTVATNGTLGGTGTILGPVTVLTNGVVAPGASIGTLTINNSLTLAGNLNIEVNKASVPTSDITIVSGTLTNAGSGTVTVTNSGGAALVPGDSFTLFNKPLANGNTMAVTGGQVIWTNKLAVDGTIAVLDLLPITPTNISFSLSGTNLTLSWPGNYLGWLLQSNIVGVAATTNWFAVPNSALYTQQVITVNPARSNVFYRMVYP